MEATNVQKDVKPHIVLIDGVKYYRKTVPRQYAKFTRKSLLFNYVVLP